MVACVATLAGCRTRLLDDENGSVEPCHGFTAPRGYGSGSLELGIGIAAADWNADGKLDLVVTGRGGADLFIGNGDGSFRGPIRVLDDKQLWYPVAADVDHDGRLDLVVANAFGILVGRDDGKGGRFQPRLSMYDPYRADLIFLTSADLDADGTPEIIGTNGSLTVFSAQRDATVIARQSVNLPRASTDRTVVGDFDGDGHLDVMVGTGSIEPHTGVVSFLPGRGDATLGAPVAWDQADTHDCVDLVAGDFDRDGALDVAVSHDAQVDVFVGDGHGRPANRASYAIGDTCAEIAAADLDGDGLLDLVVIDRHPQRFRILRGLPGGRFIESGRCGLGAEPSYGIVAGDWNGDGRPDLAFPIEGSDAFDTPGPYELAVVLNTSR